MTKKTTTTKTLTLNHDKTGNIAAKVKSVKPDKPDKAVQAGKAGNAGKPVPGFEVSEVAKLVQLNKVNIANKNRIVFMVKDGGEMFYITIAFDNQKLADLMIAKIKGVKFTEKEDNQIIKFTKRVFKALDIDDAVVMSVDGFVW